MWTWFKRTRLRWMCWSCGCHVCVQNLAILEELWKETDYADERYWHAMRILKRRG